VFRRLIALGHQPSDAEDLTAVTFLELWRRRTKVRFVEGSALPWLLVTALNVSRNAQRSGTFHIE
jgi:RNA polymerase sigma-70 factor (ECF subfamily)